ncbi:hypothetical protein BJ170DRAFT_737168 [Xylariales sp. AK1849]|nr:hypothetical protein BJ170DRAFT_737168 [Xylariales sp. AK1849]
MDRPRTEERRASLTIAAPSPIQTQTQSPSPTQSQSQPQQPSSTAPTAHPAQAPYQPYPYPQPSYVQQPRVIPFDKTWYWLKIGLTCGSLVFCIILLALSIAISVGTTFESSFTITIFWCAPLVVIAGLWDIAELITVCACGKRHGQGGRQGIHPGAHVGVDLVIWLAAVFCAFISAVAYVDAQSILRSCAEEQNDDSTYSSYYNYCDDDDLAAAKNGILIPTLRAIMAFIGLLTLVHFIIFVRACQETNQRNRSRPTLMMVPPPAMYYAPPPPGMVAYGHGGTYPVMPPQAHLSQGAAGNEKAPATQPQDNSSSYAGFFAPTGPTATPQPQHQPALAPRENERTRESEQSAV